MSFKQALFLDQFVTAMFPTSGVGIRGIGGERATLWGQNFEQHVEECAAEPPFVVPLLETHPAYLNRVEIAQVDGIDWCQLGPADHSASKGYAGEWEVSYPHAPHPQNPLRITNATPQIPQPILTKSTPHLSQGGDVGEETVAICDTLAAHGILFEVFCSFQ